MRGNDAELDSVLDSLTSYPEAVRQVREYFDRKAAAAASPITRRTGLRSIAFVPFLQEQDYDSETDEVMALCTSARPDAPVFLRAIALRRQSGEFSWLFKDQAKLLFPDSGDLISQSRNLKGRPSRGQLSLWRAERNDHDLPNHRTKFHVQGDRGIVYEVLKVPFPSAEHDSVREYIKEQVARLGPTLSKEVVFLLTDSLIVGVPSAKDLTRDDGYEGGLPSWRELASFLFEGRTFVPGPLPHSERYECETLASTLKKLFSSQEFEPGTLTKAAQRRIQELIANGGARLNATRLDRLREEIEHVFEHEGAVNVLLERAMQHESVKTAIDSQVATEVQKRVDHNAALRSEREKLEKQLSDLAEKVRSHERQQKAMVPGLSGALKEAFKKAREDGLGTLAQVAVYQALAGELSGNGNGNTSGPSQSSASTPITDVRLGGNLVRRGATIVAPTFTENISAMGLTPQRAHALSLVNELVGPIGLVPMLRGIAARLVAEAWYGAPDASGIVVECEAGLSDDLIIRGLLAEKPTAIAILDANLSPFEIYAKPLIDCVQRSILVQESESTFPKIVLSLSDGVAALPLPLSLQGVSFEINLDSEWDEADLEACIKWLDADSFSKNVPEIFSSLWRPALRRLHEGLLGLSSGDAKLFFAVVQRIRS
jgi:hypothetical protein